MSDINQNFSTCQLRRLQLTGFKAYSSTLPDDKPQPINMVALEDGATADVAIIYSNVAAALPLPSDDDAFRQADNV